MVGRDLEQFGRIRETMHFVEDNAFAAQPLQKCFRVFHRTTDAREFAVEILDVIQGLGKRGFPRPPNTAKPEDGALGPLVFDACAPKATINHTTT